MPASSDASRGLARGGDASQGVTPGPGSAFEQTLRLKLASLQDEVMLAFAQEVRDLRRQCHAPTAAGQEEEVARGADQQSDLVEIRPPSGDTKAPSPPMHDGTDAGAAATAVRDSRLIRSVVEVDELEGTEDQPAMSQKTGSSQYLMELSTAAGPRMEAITSGMEAVHSDGSLLRDVEGDVELDHDHNMFPRYIVRAEIHESCEASLHVGYHRSNTSKPALERLGARSLTSLSTELRRGSRYVLRSDSQFVVSWNWLCVLMLMKDFIVIPMDVAFSLDCTSMGRLIRAFSFITRIVWTLDIPVTCFTSIEIESVESFSPKQIRAKYFRTWFPLDLSIVVVDWAVFALASGSRNSATMLHVVRLCRLARCWRLPRFFHAKFTTSTLGFPAGSVGLALRTLRYTVAVVINIHWVACGYELAFEQKELLACPDGASPGFLQAYTGAFNWACIALAGGVGIGVSTESVWEMATVSFLKIYLLLFKLMLIGLVSYEVKACKESDSVYITRVSNAFLRQHGRSRLTPDTARRLRLFVNSYHRMGISDGVRDEARLLEALPDVLRMDINFEVRGSKLRCIYFFAHMDMENNRVLREVSDKVMSMRVLAGKDTVFVPGDPGDFTYICSEGHLSYVLDETRQRWRAQHPTAERSTGSGSSSWLGHETIGPGGWLSEGSLWTHWEHCGELAAQDRSMVCTLDAHAFHEVLKNHVQLGVIVEKYARCFVKQVNQMEAMVSDHMDLSWEMRDFLQLNSGSVMDHFVFISHHKEGAGPEAALIQEGLEKIVKIDYQHVANDLVYPIFIDSENLSDLRHLREHVVRSQHMILLLTKDVLYRPWCLVEIFTAYENGIPVVPVEIQKAGVLFEYPDEPFYAKLATGEMFAFAERRWLQQEGVDLRTLEKAIRQIFCAISMPFSPNKPQTTRATELAGMMARITAPKALFQPKKTQSSVGSTTTRCPSMGPSPISAASNNEAPRAHLTRALSLTTPGSTLNLLGAWCRMKNSFSSVESDMVRGVASDGTSSLRGEGRNSGTS